MTEVKSSLEIQTNTNYTRCKVDWESTSGICKFLGQSLVSWFSKKQNFIALSTIEAEYVAVESCCAQVIWIKQQMEDYGLHFDHIPINCANTSVINLSKNPIQHLRTKTHWDSTSLSKKSRLKGRNWAYIYSHRQVISEKIFPLDKKIFYFIRRELGMSQCDILES